MLKIKLFGDRVLFKPIEEEITGSILLPIRQNKKYELGEVIKLGDGKYKDTAGNQKEAKMLVAIGDYIFFQVNPMMAQNNAVRLEGKTYMTIIQHDMIARLKSPKVSLENFEILGYWLLLDSFEDKVGDSRIVLPDNVGMESRALRYKVKQKGALADNVEVGQEVIIEKRAASIVTINDEYYWYLDSRHVYGVVEQ